MEHLLDVILALIALACVAYYYGTRNHDYWKKRGVIGPKPFPFLGTMKAFLLSTESTSDLMKRYYREYAGEPYVGFFNASRPVLLIRDPELIRSIFSKDFDYFPDRSLSCNDKVDPLSANLFMIEGMRWKNLRIKLSPTFSSGKIKNMFPLMLDISKELVKALEEPASRGETMEMRDILARFSADVIGSCAFGIDCNGLKNKDSEFHKNGIKIFEPSLRNKVRFFALTAFPKAHLLHKIAHDQKLTDFFINLVKETVKHREHAAVKRNDFMDLLLEIKKKGKIVDDDVDIVQDPFLKVPVSTSAEELKFTDNLMAAQLYVFFAAGFETSSTTMSFCLAELAHYPEIQDKIQAEVDAILKKYGDFTYEAISEMTYLDKVVSETLRMHAPGARIGRTSSRAYKMPNSQLVLEPGTLIYVPVTGLHHDPAYYPDPERFDPERFSPEAIAARPGYTYLPFGEGPRICIGMRFALLETKLGLASVLARYRVEPSPLAEYPIQYAKGTFVAASKDNCRVILKKPLLQMHSEFSEWLSEFSECYSEFLNVVQKFLNGIQNLKVNSEHF